MIYLLANLFKFLCIFNYNLTLITSGVLLLCSINFQNFIKKIPHCIVVHEGVQISADQVKMFEVTPKPEHACK